MSSSECVECIKPGGIPVIGDNDAFKIVLTVACGVVLAMVGAGGIAPAVAAEPVNALQPVSFDIKPQPLASALNAFAVQSHQTILFTPEIVSGKTSPGVKGIVAPVRPWHRLWRVPGSHGHGLPME